MRRLCRGCMTVFGLIAWLCCTGGSCLAGTKQISGIPFVSAAPEAVYVRRTPSEEGQVIGKLYPTGTGTILRETEDGNWALIRSGKVRGYVAAQVLSSGKEAQALRRDAAHVEAQVQPGGAQVFAEADEASELAAVAEAYTYLVVLQENATETETETETEPAAGWLKVRTPLGICGWTRADQVQCRTVYSTAETVAAEDARLARIREANDTASLEAELWETAEQALLEAADCKTSLLEVQMEEDAAQEAFKDAGGGKEAADSLRAAIAKKTQAQAAADAASKEAEEKVTLAQKASVEAQAAEKVAAEESRLAPRGAEGSEFVTMRDHSIYVETSVGQELVNYACQFVGGPYVWGGESLTDGCDCSGFTMLVYARYGITLPHFAQSQAMYGDLVSEEELEPGDLVFFQNSTGYIHHVAIYIGNHSIVHAANSVSGICFSNLHYSSDRIICRRLLTQ